MTQAARWSEYKRVLAYLRPYWRQLAIVLSVSMVSTLVGLAQPYITKLLIDDALLQRNMRVLAWVAGGMVGLTVFGFAIGILSSYHYVRLSAAVLFDMRVDLYQHLQRLSPRFYARTKMGEIVSRLNNDISEVQRVAADTLLGLLSNLVFLAGSVIIMLLLQPKLFWVSIALVPVSLWALRRCQSRLDGQVRDVRERSSDIGGFLLETLLGMRLVVTSASEGAATNRFRHLNGRFVDALLAMQVTSFLAGAIPGTVLALSTATVFLYGGTLVVNGALSIGGLVAFMAYHMRLLAPVQSLMGLYTNVITGGVSLRRVLELWDVQPEVVESSTAQPLHAAQGEITVDRVRFSYDRAQPALEEVSFQIPAGSVTAIMGPSGSGKSTLADLLIRLYDPESGTVQLDGHDLRDLRLADVRRTIAVVEQTPFLLHTTIGENLRFGCPEATDAQLEAATRTAMLHSFIESLPHGYDTVVGERGLALSAGERQRLALARALLREPKVLILDEPTAALDVATEQALCETLRVALQGRTVLLLTHRLPLLALADQVFVLQQGRLVPTHAEAATA